ncbi:MAG: hypothetical protein QOG95_5148 [Mycobacterium sp.]|jgi:hypothetical protein|nr:hypothetical protein [Mycobacterium sp.]
MIAPPTLSSENTHFAAPRRHVPPGEHNCGKRKYKCLTWIGRVGVRDRGRTVIQAGSTAA